MEFYIQQWNVWVRCAEWVWIEWILIKEFLMKYEVWMNFKLQMNFEILNLI